MGVCYLQVEGLTKSYGDRVLFGDISFGIDQGEKVGLVARNGTGKSTFLDILTGRESPDSGSVIWRNGIRVGYLEQQPPLDSDLNAVDYATPDCPAGLTPGEWNGRDMARQMLGQFGIDDMTLPVCKLSGGQAKRVALAKVLLTEPDMIILDEPTNHLDIEIVEWLEDYLQRRKVTLLMVTHDRWTLDRVCNRIIEIEGETLYSYDGNYDYYIQKRTERMENREAELGRVRNLLRGELEWMRRQPQARGSKAKYRIDNFYDLEARSHSAGPEKDVRLDVKAGYIGSKIFEAKNVCKAFGDKVILRDWSYTFARYEKVGVVGPNGVGKSTFIKILLNRLQPDSGTIDTGQTVKWGYYSQEGITGFDENAKVIDAVRTITDRVRIDDKTTLTAQQFLTRFLFTPKDQQKFIHKLSGGERRRLYLATVLMQEPNFLVLDEPTNDLDIMTLAVLEDYLANFKGCVIVVSHDRYFLDRVAQHLFVFKGDGEIKDFPGDYSTYRHCVAQERAAKRSESAAADPAKKAQKQNRPRTEQKRKMSFKERREYEQLQTRLEQLGAERAELEASMNSGTLTHEELSAAGVRIQQIIDETDSSEFRLLELMELED
jgi:ATP-binding cassette subfamily F protein uup